MRERIQWIDIGKGIAICLVILGHTWRSLFASNIVTNETTFHVVDRAIYSFHVPLLFLLSGYLIEASVKRRGVVNYWRSTAITLLVPLFIWTLILNGLRVASSAYINSPPPLTLWLLSPLPPHDTMWFFWALFVIEVLAAPLVARGLPAPAYAAIAAIAYAVSSAVDVQASAMVGPAIYNACFFFVGAALAKTAVGPTGRAGLLLLLVSALAIGTAGVLALPTWIYMPLSVVAIVSFVLAMRSATPRWLAFFVPIGLASLGIYVSHTIFTSTTRIVLMKLGVRDATVHVVLAFAAGLILSYAFCWVAAKLGLFRWLGLGNPDKVFPRRVTTSPGIVPDQREVPVR